MRTKRQKRNGLRRCAVILAAVMVFGSTVCAEETQTEAAQAAAEGTALSDDWKDYQIQVNDQVYEFPMMYEDFVALGWTTDDNVDSDGNAATLEPNQYCMLTFENAGLGSDVKCYGYALNFGINTVSVEECIIGGMSMDAYDWDLTQAAVRLPGGIERGVSTVEDIEAAYGTPSDTYEGSLYTKLTYSTDSYCEVEMSVYLESGVLEDIDIRNFTEPEGFDAGEASDEVPEAVAAYEKPAELSDNLEDYQISVDGEVYAMPVPVSVLIADGWELDEENTDAVISAGYFGWVKLFKGGQSISTTVSNYEDYATIPENCWIEELEVGGYTLEAEGELPCGITVGMSEEAFLQILEDTGVDYEAETDSDTYHYYNFCVKAYDQAYQVVIYKGDDGSFGQDTIMKLSCSNTF